MARPKKYTEIETIQNKIDEYFDSCFRPMIIKGDIIRDDKGKIICEQYKPFTICGIANALDMSRQSLLNYEKDNQFFDTITRAKRKCEQYAEERLFDKDGVNGAKFSLMNNYSNWKDKQEVKTTTASRITIVDDLPEEDTDE